MPLGGWTRLGRGWRRVIPCLHRAYNSFLRQPEPRVTLRRISITMSKKGGGEPEHAQRGGLCCEACWRFSHRAKIYCTARPLRFCLFFSRLRCAALLRVVSSKKWIFFSCCLSSLAVRWICAPLGPARTTIYIPRELVHLSVLTADKHLAKTPSQQRKFPSSLLHLRQVDQCLVPRCALRSHRVASELQDTSTGSRMLMQILYGLAASFAM